MQDVRHLAPDCAKANALRNAQDALLAQALARVLAVDAQAARAVPDVLGADLHVRAAAPARAEEDAKAVLTHVPVLAQGHAMALARGVLLARAPVREAAAHIAQALVRDIAT